MVFRRLMSSSAPGSSIAFLGLGNMGLGMASNLKKAGHSVTVFDPSPKAQEAAAEAGLCAAPTPVQAAEGADAVISMLPTGKHAKAVYIGDGATPGLLDTVSKSTVCLDCSTIDAATAREIGEAAAAKGVGYMDSPVSGGTAAAAAGTLAFMCGGPEATFARAKPLLEAMGPKIFHAGPAGAGQVAKACNNMLLAIHMIGTAEALEMGARSGLAPEVLSEIMLASSGRNWSLEVYNPYPGVMEGSPASKGYPEGVGFMVDLMLKDLGLAMDAAKGVGVELSMGAKAQQLYAAHRDAGNGARDFSSIINALKDK